MEEGKVLGVAGTHVVAGIGAHAVVERADVLVGPQVPEVLQLAVRLPHALGLRTGEGRAKEEVVGKLVVGLCAHVFSFACICISFRLIN